jgi:hypothetical protein
MHAFFIGLDHPATALPFLRSHDFSETGKNLGGLLTVMCRDALYLWNARLLALEEIPLIRGNGVLSFIGGMRPLIGGRSVTPFC